MINSKDIQVILTNKRNTEALIVLLMRLSRPDLYKKEKCII